MAAQPQRADLSAAPGTARPPRPGLAMRGDARCRKREFQPVPEITIGVVARRPKWLGPQNLVALELPPIVYAVAVDLRARNHAAARQRRRTDTHCSEVVHAHVETHGP